MPAASFGVELCKRTLGLGQFSPRLDFYTEQKEKLLFLGQNYDFARDHGARCMTTAKMCAHFQQFSI